MTADEAVILMVDSNIHWENLLPSEKAFGYKMKLEAMKRTAGRPSKENCDQLGHNYDGKKSIQILADDSTDSKSQIQRYIRLTELIKPILDLVDSRCIAFSPAVELSYLAKEEQAGLWDIMQQVDYTPSLSQTVRMKKLSQEVKLSPEEISAVMSEEKANQKPQVRISTERLGKSIRITFRLNSQECQQFKNQVAKTGLSQESYLRTMINGYIPKELPSPDYHAMMKELRAIGNNLNQIAARANATGHIDRTIFQAEADRLRQAVLDIQAAVTLPERRVKE